MNMYLRSIDTDLHDAMIQMIAILSVRQTFQRHPDFFSHQEVT